MLIHVLFNYTSKHWQVAIPVFVEGETRTQLPQTVFPHAAFWDHKWQQERGWKRHSWLFQQTSPLSLLSIADRCVTPPTPQTPDSQEGGGSEGVCVDGVPWSSLNPGNNTPSIKDTHTHTLVPLQPDLCKHYLCMVNSLLPSHGREKWEDRANEWGGVGNKEKRSCYLEWIV